MPKISISGIVSAAPVQGATVTAYALKDDGTTGESLATATTDATGSYSMSVPQATVLLVATGGSYREEATGATVQVGDRKLRAAAVITDLSTTVAINSLTDMAAARAIASLAGSTDAKTAVRPMTSQAKGRLAADGNLAAAAVAAANAAMASLIGIADLLVVLPADPTKPLTVNSSSAEAIVAYYLAAISQTAKNGGSSSLDVTVSIGTALINGDTSFWNIVLTAGTQFVASAGNLAHFTIPPIPPIPPQLNTPVGTPPPTPNWSLVPATPTGLPAIPQMPEIPPPVAVPGTFPTAPPFAAPTTPGDITPPAMPTLYPTVAMPPPPK